MYSTHRKCCWASTVRVVTRTRRYVACLANLYLCDLLLGPVRHRSCYDWSVGRSVLRYLSTFSLVPCLNASINHPYVTVFKQRLRINHNRQSDSTVTYDGCSLGNCQCLEKVINELINVLLLPIRRPWNKYHHRHNHQPTQHSSLRLVADYPYYLGVGGRIIL